MAALTGINKIWLWQLVDGHWQWLRVAPPPPPPAGPPPKAPPGPRQTRSQRALQKSFASSTDIWPLSWVRTSEWLLNATHYKMVTSWITKRYFHEWRLLALLSPGMTSMDADEYDACRLTMSIVNGWHQEPLASKFYDYYLVLQCFSAWSWLVADHKTKGGFGRWLCQFEVHRVRDNVVPQCFYNWSSLVSVVSPGGSVSASDGALTVDDDTPSTASELLCL